MRIPVTILKYQNIKQQDRNDPDHHDKHIKTNVPGLNEPQFTTGPYKETPGKVDETINDFYLYPLMKKPGESQERLHKDRFIQLVNIEFVVGEAGEKIPFDSGNIRHFLIGNIPFVCNDDHHA